MIKSKKANIPITLLVLGVLAVCSLTLLSFYSSEQKVQGTFSQIFVIQTVDLISDKFLLYSVLINSKTLDEQNILASVNSMYKKVSFLKKSGAVNFNLQSSSFFVEKPSEEYVITGTYTSTEYKFFVIPYEKEVLYVQYPYHP
ncbi:Uncharacterised protein [uncultured archaeon]|nr:Uncharacterised protein [uncultured archaeon]